jgi:hypothetical protein
MMLPHWLDEVIGDLRDPNKIAQAVANSPKFLQIVKSGVEKANSAESKRNGPKILGAGINQIIRQAVVEGVQNNNGNVPE